MYSVCRHVMGEGGTIIWNASGSPKFKTLVCPVKYPLDNLHPVPASFMETPIDVLSLCCCKMQYFVISYLYFSLSFPTLPQILFYLSSLSFTSASHLFSKVPSYHSLHLIYYPILNLHVTPKIGSHFESQTVKK